MPSSPRSESRRSARLAVLTATLWLAACGGSSSTTEVPPPPLQPPPPPAASATPVAISAGGLHTCAVSDAGKVFCWGRGDYGALGGGPAGKNPAYKPEIVSTDQTFAAVSAGYVHTCGITVAGGGYCWGWNYERSTVEGALGDGTNTSRPAPVAVVDGHVFREIAAGGHHSCGATTGGPTFCWGRNLNGELGSGDNSGIAQLRPVLVAGGHQFHGFALGYRWSCALEQDGAAFCWGDGGAGQGGNGNNNPIVLTPVPVTGGHQFTTLSSAQFGGHVCGIATDSLAYCWGLNSFGQLGDGTTTDRSAPTRVSGGLKFVAIGAGGYYSCGLTAAGQVYCWGNLYAAGSASAFGQPGDSIPKPLTAPGGVTFEHLTVGAANACALTGGKVVYCWGTGGFVGDNSVTDRDTPTPVAGFKTSPP